MLEPKTLDRKQALKVQIVASNGAREGIVSVLKRLEEPQLKLLNLSPQMDSAPVGSPDVVMIEVGDEPESALRQLEALGQAEGAPVRFALVADRSAQATRRALRSGADEVLFLPLEPADVARALLKVSEVRWRDTRPGHGEICSVVSVNGGVGVTSLAVNLALALRYTTSRQVAFVDLDFQSADAAVQLNLEPERTILDIADPGAKLDSIQLEAALTKHPSGIYLLSAPRKIQEGERISAIQVGTALDLMRQMFDLVIVDNGSHINENSVAAWERSDRLLYVVDQSISAVRGAWRFLDLFNLLGLSTPGPDFVLNRLMPRHSISEAQIANTLARTFLARIPRDDGLLEQSMSRAQDLWKLGRGSALVKALEGLAGKIAGVAPALNEDRARRRVFGWLFPASAANA